MGVSVGILRHNSLRVSFWDKREARQVNFHRGLWFH